MKLDLLKKIRKMLGRGEKDTSSFAKATADEWGRRQLREIAKLGGKMVVM